MRFLRMLLINLVAAFAWRRRHKLWASNAAIAEMYRGVTAP